MDRMNKANRQPQFNTVLPKKEILGQGTLRTAFSEAGSGTSGNHSTFRVLSTTDVRMMGFISKTRSGKIRNTGRPRQWPQPPQFPRNTLNKSRHQRHCKCNLEPYLGHDEPMKRVNSPHFVISNVQRRHDGLERGMIMAPTKI